MDQPDQPQLQDLPTDVWGVIDAFLADEDRLAYRHINKAAHEDEALSKVRQGVGYAHGPTELAALVADADITVIIVPGGTISQHYPGKTIVAYGPVAVAGGAVYARHPQASITSVTGGWVYASDSVQVTGVSGGAVNAHGSAQVTGVTGGQVDAHNSAQVTGVTGGRVDAHDSVQVSGVTGGAVYAFGSAQVTGVTGGQIRVTGEQVTVIVDRAAAFNAAGQVVWVDEPTTIVVTDFYGGPVPARVIVSGPDGPLQRPQDN